jgi:ubiquinone/menaquinone biosynthesis C-methylase UbiE
LKDQWMENQRSNADVEHFNRRAATYETASSQGYFFDRIQRRVLKTAQASDPKTVLDVGCGTGRLLRKAKQKWPDAHLVGVDAAENMITQARRLFPDAEFHVGMAEELPLPDSSVDLTFSTLSFHHWANQSKGIMEVARVLDLGGTFLLADIAIPAWMRVFVRNFRYNSPAKIRGMFEAAGLAVEFQQRPWSWSRVILITVGKKTQGMKQAQL